MKENENNPLGLEDKVYTIEEFGADLRNKFGGDNYISKKFYLHFYSFINYL